MSADNELDNKIKQAFMAEHMPEGLSSKTLEFIHQKAAAAAQEAEVQEDPVNYTAQKPKKLVLKRMVQLMAACLVMAALAIGGLALASETAQIELAGTASVQLGLNRWGMVMRVDCTDPNLRDDIEKLGLYGLTCTDALNKLAQEADLQNRLAGGDTLVLIAAAASEAQQAQVLEACESAAAQFSVTTTCAGPGNGAGKGFGLGQGKGQGQGNEQGQGPGQGQGHGQGLGNGQAQGQSQD